MNLAECDQAAADIIREYARNGKFCVIIRSRNENVRVICPEIDVLTTVKFLNQAADVLFDGVDIKSRPV